MLRWLGTTSEHIPAHLVPLPYGCEYQGHVFDFILSYLTQLKLGRRNFFGDTTDLFFFSLTRVFLQVFKMINENILYL